MAMHVLTELEMSSLGNLVFEENDVSGSDTIASTGHTPHDWIQEVNDALRSLAESIFGHSYTNRSVVSPYPPLNMNGDIEPPDILPSTAQLDDMAQSFVGYEIEIR
ncbi:hypothetical protein J7K50_02120 [bacterium]|nr:hypothetical protein [bacterium]